MVVYGPVSGFGKPCFGVAFIEMFFKEPKVILKNHFLGNCAVPRPQNQIKSETVTAVK